MSLRHHLQSIHRQTGKMPDQLADAAKLPEGCGMVWRDFLTLDRMRGSTGFGPAHISYVDIDAMQRVRGFALRPWEVAAILAADAAYFEHKAAAK